jgi:NTE family protein
LLRRPKLGLALGSGGARGLAHIGILKVFERERIPIDIITGSSAGSLIGAMYALNPNIQFVENKIRHYLNGQDFKASSSKAQ